jgi:putative phosphoribosyl transferase
METVEISIPVNDLRLKASLCVPPFAESLIIFSHGSGSSRFSPRNRKVAEFFNQEKIATLLVDLLTVHEDLEVENRFDIQLLSERLVEVTAYIRELKELRDLPVGYFGASTGAASALQAAARFGDKIHAVVSRGGRPDLAKNPEDVVAPVLFIVGSLDKEVIKLNKLAASRLKCEHDMIIVEGASHLFEEAGKLEVVKMLALDWFRKHLKSNPELHAV